MNSAESTDIYGCNTLIERFLLISVIRIQSPPTADITVRIAVHLDRSSTDRGRQRPKRPLESRELMGKRQE